MPKLLVVVIDGLRTDTLACAHVPCFDNLARSGVLARRLQPSRPCLTLPTLVSLLTSLPPEEHGVLSNSGISQVSPHAVSLFSLLRYRHQNSAAFYSNDRLRLLFPPGSLQTGVLINSQSIRNVDRELTASRRPGICNGKSRTAACSISKERILPVSISALPRNPIWKVSNRLTVPWVAPGTPGCGRPAAGLCDHGYGMLRRRRRRIEAIDEPGLPLLLSGPGIRQGEEIEQPLSLLDLTPTMAGILGLAAHPDWRGRVLAEAFHRQPLELKTLGRKKGPGPGNGRSGTAQAKKKRGANRS